MTAHLSALAALNIEGIQTDIQKSQLTSIESVLEHLSEKEPNFLSKFTLIYQSQSLQDASPEFPRAVVFGDSGDLIMSFNGHQTQKGYENLEFIQFRNRKFEFYEVTFGDGLPKFSQMNPPKCFRCHRGGHPIWADYSTWKGVYGSEDDVMAPVLKPGETTSIYESLLVRQKEYEDFLQFRKNLKGTRYQWLPFEADSPIAPYSPKRFYSDYRYRPNLLLTKLLTEQQSQSIIDKLESNKACYDQTSELLLLNLKQCRGYLSPEEALTIESLNETTTSANQLLYPEYTETTFEQTYRTEKDGRYLGALLTLMGVDRLDWNLDPKATSWAYSDGKYNLSVSVADELEKQLVKPLPRQVTPTEYPFSPEESYQEPESPRTIQCRSLLKKAVTKMTASSAELARICKPDNQQLVEDRKSLIAMCLTCHNGSEGPALPLEDSDFWVEKQLPPAFFSLTESEGMMPPNRRLSYRELYLLKHYIGNEQN